MKTTIKEEGKTLLRELGVEKPYFSAFL